MAYRLKVNLGQKNSPLTSICLMVTAVMVILACHPPAAQASYYTKKLGEACRGKGFGNCLNGLTCEYKEKGSSKQICFIRYGQPCAHNRTMCSRGRACSYSTNICKNKVKGYCSSSGDCVMGAYCKRKNKYGGKCACSDNWEKTGESCAPKAGVVGQPCNKSKDCVDTNGRCNRKTNLCECKTGFVPSYLDLTCKADVGQACGGNQSIQCKPGTTCDTDNVCRLHPGDSCTGDRASLCKLDDLCIGGYCRNKMNESCEWYFNSRICEPPGECDFKKRCTIPRHRSCAQHPEMCERDVHCDTVTKTCLNRINSFCYFNDEVCPYGTVCVNNKCVCRGTYNNQTIKCDLSEGLVGGPCRNETACDDENARCNTDGVCECKPHHVVSNIHSLTCDLVWKKCSMTGNGRVRSFFNSDINVRLPCRYRLATVKCGTSKVEVYGENSYDARIHNTFLSGLVVSITDKTKNGILTSLSFTVSQATVNKYLKRNSSRGSAWRKVSGSASIKGLRLSTDASAGAVLAKALLKIVYKPPQFTKVNKTLFTVHSWGGMSLECAHSNFQSPRGFPQALCGTLDGAEDVRNYKSRVERLLKKELGDDYDDVPTAAFSQERLTDRAVLVDQQLPQSNPLCTVASDLVSDKTCPALQKKLYECSNTFDANNPDYASYPACVDQAIEDPVKLLVSCLDAQCGRLKGDVRNDTCSTLKTASDLCDHKKGSNSTDLPTVVKMSDLRALANCSQTSN